MTKLTSRLSALGLTLLAFTSACDDTILEPTFGSGCVQGTLSAGQTVTGSLSPASCRLTYHFYSDDVMPYESWSVHLDKGKAYLFYLQQAPDPAQDGLNDVDALLTLYGKDDQGRSIPLAVSDDEGGGIDGHDSEFWFVAPRSGDFILTAGSYDWDDFGGYRLSMSSCPVLGVLDTAGTYEFSSPHSSCIRHSDNASALLTMSFLSVPVDTFETLSIKVDHDASNAWYELGGPDFDTYANIWDESSYDYNSYNSNAYVSMDEVGGRVTIAIGTLDFDSPGTYTVTLGRMFEAAPPPASSRDGRLTMRAPAPKKAK